MNSKLTPGVLIKTTRMHLNNHYTDDSDFWQIEDGELLTFIRYDDVSYINSRSTVLDSSGQIISGFCIDINEILDSEMI